MKRYDHKSIERKWQLQWAKKKVYRSTEKKGKKKCYVLDMFPYPSGEGLHVGHPKGYIASDIYSRFQRMRGRSVLHPMGWDAFGLPAENYALQNKVHPRVAVKKNIARFKEQLSHIGFDYDWDREINTTDPEYYKWTQWIFLQLFKKGLAYQSDEPINWCPSCKTGLANEDLEGNACERCGTVVEQKRLPQWVLRITDYADRLLADLDTLPWPEYIKELQRNWIGKSEGALIKFQILKSKFQIEVFTTRPDTLFGATYLTLAPEHTLVQSIYASQTCVNSDEVEDYIKAAAKKSDLERQEHKEKTGVLLEGIRAVNPATKEEIPIFVADYVLAGVGTGAIMAVPAHDERDFEFAKKYNISIRDVIMPHLPDPTNPHQPNKEVVHRRATINIVYDPKTDRYLTLRWKKQPWITYVTGGVENGEDVVESARREIAEETGYTDVRFVRKLGGDAQAEFYAAHKGVNRVARNSLLLFELASDAREKIDPKEAEKHEVVWIPARDLTKTRFQHSEAQIITERIFSGMDAYMGEGILIDSGEFSGTDSAEARKKITARFGTPKTTYKLRDWIFSRQRYWGEPIPMIHCEKCGVVPVSEKYLPVILPEVKSYAPSGTGESPLANITKWVNTKCPTCGGKGRRETNTMPQWAGSSWYHIAYCISENLKSQVPNSKQSLSTKLQNKIQKWLPVDVYVGGVEHATRHLIYARFWHKFLHDIGIVSTMEPFIQLHTVGLVLAEDGRKMSKRFKNTIDPDDVVKLYGADTLRLYEMFMGPFENTIAWKTESLIGVRRFLERIWRRGQLPASSFKLPENPNLQTSLHRTIKKITEDIAAFKFNTAISQLMIFMNAAEKEKTIGKKQWEIFLKLLAPFVPHVAEELWSQCGGKGSIHLQKWPEYDEKFLKDETVTIAVQIDGKVRGEVTIATRADKVEHERAAREVVATRLQGREVVKVIVVPNRLVNFVLRT
ncbi:leucine--tRNA ligase [Candidatus Kaiserbacteria bacterium RIFCSPHIGHO2_01_FULL_50_13]|uniref:Leucine--tRNA ligase n=1 Tax=Candidatus Kaiserbacteria bacterium RIFCSPLOWO2_01_FULL_50_24 TaxID=1798507 RepID=A0A1F6EMV7_9BACT|nr:MAG: leucine--tRNA ligase [Candidatus Kaiserbacteria bacterium RIFCSPHIGHO2_01_FULL_50_13]OGG74978.1 MAG: leucine--tRNA ligase [Candidatus Kaiserbacteria bacterium RIFCSPLOWO2_01_FULL_50_24]OGG81781.1 MAG: leucine--tRNA ligase [Candidatus Kaiserbacteria bacterium RIFCSPLOWO2_02_FULL_51_13]